ncbi:MAG: hypothetical protein FWC32_13060 [Firmicutes bacterium]|nr:hypothetical protein [Bacillota bacterium]
MEKILFKKPMSLIVSLYANDSNLVEAAWDNGADIVKVHMNVHHHASGTLFGNFDAEQDFFRQTIAEKRGPVGIVAGGDIQSVTRDYEKAAYCGFDFVSLYAQHMPARCLTDKRMLHAMALDYRFPIDMVPYLPTDILEVAIIDPNGYGQPLNALDVAMYRTIASKTNLPMVIPTQRNITVADLPQLKEAGVAAVMIGAIVTGKTIDSLKKSVTAFREGIDKL